MVAMHYSPGICNINDAEVSFRKRAGYFFSAISLTLFLLLVMFKVDSLFGFAMLFPIWIASVQFLQVKNRFCAGYGLRAVYSGGDGLSQLATVSKVEERLLDRKKAATIYLQGFLLSLVGAFLVVFVLELI